MSSLQAPPSYRSQLGGTVHVETDDPALLSLLCDSSTAKTNRPSDNAEPSPHAVVFHPSQHSSGSVDRKEERTGSTTLRSEPLGTSREDNCDPLRTRERSVKENAIPGKQSSVSLETVLPRSADPTSTIPLPPADVYLVEQTENKKEGEGEEVATNAGAGISDACLNTSGQSGLKRDLAEHQKVSDPAASFVISPLPDSDHVASSPPSPSPLPDYASRVSAPDLSSPEHPRFVTPYSSRRLKDRPANGKPVIAVFDEKGIQTQLNVPKDQGWNREQAARLKAGVRENPGPGSQQTSISPSPQRTTHSHSLLAVAEDTSARTNRRPEEVARQPSTHTEQDRDSQPQSVERSKTGEVKHQSHPQTHQGDQSRQKRSPPQGEIQHPVHSHTISSPDGSMRIDVDRRPQGPVTVSDQLLPSPSQNSLKYPGADQSMDRVYVDSPSFTQEEEEEYRFVSSRADNEEGLSDSHHTYRGLDQQALNNMEGATATSRQPIRKPFKQVRYQDDEDRFENREDILQYSSAAQDFKPPPETQTQYVLRSKTNSAKTVDEPLPQPVRSLTLPSGPSYDPQDEEDLKREATYQQELKNRVDTLQRAAESSVIPPINPESDNWPAEEEMEQDNSRYQHHRDSLTMYDGHRLPQTMQNTQWGDVPQPIYGNPHSYAGAPHNYAGPTQNYTGPTQNYAGPTQNYTGPTQNYTGPTQNYAGPSQNYAGPSQNYAGPTHRGYADQEPGQGYVADLEGRSYADAERRGGYPRTQMGYGDSYNREQYEEADYADMLQANSVHHPAGDNNYASVPQGQYSNGQQEPQMGYPQQGYAEPRDGYYLTEPRGYAQNPAPVYNQEEEDTAVPPLPTQPIDEDRYQVEDSTQRPSPRHYSGTITLPHRPDYDYVSHNKTDYGFTPKRTYMKIKEVKRREEEKLNHFFIQPKARGGRTKKGSRDSSPARPLAITYHPGEAGQGPEEVWAQRSAYLAQANNAKVSPAQSPPFYPGDIIQPAVTQHIVTEDGQRISVDVNLRLVSPPVGPEGEGYGGQPPFPRQTGLQYPLAEVRATREEAHSDSHDYTDPVYTTTVSPNPYRKIPPIGAGSEEAPNSAPTQTDGSYMLSYLREKEKQMSMEKPWYRIYGIGDYKRMQKEVQLGRGTLGPDLENDTFREKRDKMLRKLDYAKAVKDRNMRDLMARKPATFPREKEQDDMLSKRKLAVEYAKNVPKPTVKPKANASNSYEMASKLSPIAKPDKGQKPRQDKATVEVLDIDKLQKRHQADKRSAEILQRKAQEVAS